MSKVIAWQRVSVLLPDWDDVEGAEASAVAQAKAGHVFSGSALGECCESQPVDLVSDFDKAA